MAKLADAPDLGSGTERCKSSSLFFPTSLFLAQFGRASALGAEGQRFKSFRIDHCEGGEIGRHKRLKISRPLAVRVRVPSLVPEFRVVAYMV